MKDSRARHRRGDGGYATAETAAAMPALLLIMSGALWGVTAATQQLRCMDAAREGARTVARGEDPSAVVAAVRRAAPPHATVHISTGGALVRVTVAADVRPLGGLAGRLPALHVSADATAAREDQVPGVVP